MKYFLATVLATAAVLLLFLSGDAVSGKVERAKEGPKNRQLFWAGESWLKSIRESASNHKTAGALRQWENTLRWCEDVLDEDARTPVEQAYLEALRAYLILDYPSVREAWSRLEPVPAYREEVRWFLYGPSAAYFEEACQDWRWRRAAAFFETGWEAYSNRNWSAAIALFEQSLSQRPDHFLAERFLRLSLDKRVRAEGKAPSRRVWPDEVRSFRGSDVERLRKGEEAFRLGDLFTSLSWFESLARQGSVPDIRARGRRAARRLEWMFPVKRT